MIVNRLRPARHLPSTWSSPGAKRPPDAQPQARENALGILSFLTRDDLADLRPLLQTVSPRIMDLVVNWFQLYKLQYHDRRSLTETEFQQLFGISLLKSTRSLLDDRLGDYANEVRRLGVALAHREVPFEEVALVHLYWTMGMRIFADSGTFDPKVYRAFEKLNYVRMTLLGEAYFRYWTAEQGVRISETEREAARIPPEERSQFHGLIGTSVTMRALYKRIESAGQTRGTVLIVGESGTGKELVARAIHECGADAGAPFVALNCAALPTHLIESELFGYRRGAFSGANADYLGLFRAAEGGTLFLDEITEMSAETQSKLLRAVQERKVRPVGRDLRARGERAADRIHQSRPRCGRAQRTFAPGPLLSVAGERADDAAAARKNRRYTATGESLRADFQ